MRSYKFHLENEGPKLLFIFLVASALLAYNEVWINGGIHLQQYVEEQKQFLTKNSTEINEIYIPPLPDDILEIHKRLNLVNPGYMGAAIELPANIPADIKEIMDSSISEFQFNEFLSRLMPFYRELPDYRRGACLNITYDVEKLPKVSIVISFFNEPFSMLMRTVYSILKSSPLELIEEIILVDDASDNENLLASLQDLIPKVLKVRLLTLPSRLGLMKARTFGVANAKAEVIVIMDAHMEVTPNWLPPLLEPIIEDPHTVTLPGIEPISSVTLEYKDSIWENYEYVGGFTWDLMYTWTKGRPWPTGNEHPIQSPTMMGACFAIRKDYFESLGFYDEELGIWGGDNLELSFKIWMCGGRMLHTYCSHVGHVYKNRPYSDEDSQKLFLRNTDRIAEVWMDDYKRFYHRSTNFTNRDFGDVSKQIELRKKLGCNSFQWYVENIYPGLEIPENLRDSMPEPHNIEKNLKEKIPAREHG